METSKLIIKIIAAIFTTGYLIAFSRTGITKYGIWAILCSVVLYS